MQGVNGVVAITKEQLEIILSDSKSGLIDFGKENINFQDVVNNIISQVIVSKKADIDQALEEAKDLLNISLFEKHDSIVTEVKLKAFELIKQNISEDFLEDIKKQASSSLLVSFQELYKIESADLELFKSDIDFIEKKTQELQYQNQRKNVFLLNQSFFGNLQKFEVYANDPEIDGVYQVESFAKDFHVFNQYGSSIKRSGSFVYIFDKAGNEIDIMNVDDGYFINGRAIENIEDFYKDTIDILMPENTKYFTWDLPINNNVSIIYGDNVWSGGDIDNNVKVTNNNFIVKMKINDNLDIDYLNIVTKHSEELPQPSFII